MVPQMRHENKHEGEIITAEITEIIQIRISQDYAFEKWSWNAQNFYATRLRRCVSKTAMLIQCGDKVVYAYSCDKFIK